MLLPQAKYLSIMASLALTMTLSACNDQAASLPLNHKQVQLNTPPTEQDALAYQFDTDNNDQGAEKVPATNTGGWTIATTNRQLVRGFYNSVYSASLDTPIGWTGDQGTCLMGTTTADFKNSVLARVNYFRAMAGVPAVITFNSTYNAKAQQAALMMSANNVLSHYPSTTWSCYTADGYQAAGSSNISLGANGWDAVAGQMQDNGANNSIVGHRRWLLYPQTKTMGTGDVAAKTAYKPAHALWVFDGLIGTMRPATRDTYVAWPTNGFNPYQIVPIRWSFSYPNADFTNATVTMTQGTTTVPLTIDSRTNGYGENTIVWRPYNWAASTNWPKPSADTSYFVKVNNVMVNGVATNFTYTVAVIDPQTPATNELKTTITGNTIPTTGVNTTYSFNSISFAKGYDARIAELAAATQSYTAETTSPTVTNKTSGSYTLLYSGTGSNGTTVYRLAPTTNSEVVEFPITYVPSSTSSLTFSSKLGYATTFQTAAIQLSTDDGASWQDIYTKTGTSSGYPEQTSFATQTISLAAYANKFIKLRAQYRVNTASTYTQYTGTSPTVSFLLDNLSVTNAQRITTDTIKDTGTATSFSFIPVAGKRYALAARVKPWVGYPALEWGPTFYAKP